MHYSLLQTSGDAAAAPSTSTGSRSKLLMAVGAAVLCLQGIYFLSTSSKVSTSITSPAAKYRVSAESGGEGKLVGTIPNDYCKDPTVFDFSLDHLVEKRGGDTALSEKTDCAALGVNTKKRDLIYYYTDEILSHWWMVVGEEGRAVKCVWTDPIRKYDWKDKSMRPEVCRMIHANEGTGNDKHIAPQVYDAWQCKVDRFTWPEFDDSRFNQRLPDRYEPSVMTCVEVDYMPGNGRGVLHSLKRHDPDTAPAVQLTHEAIDRLADAVEKGVVMNTAFHSGVAEVRNHAVLYGWEHAHMCKTGTMPDWLRPIAFTYMLMKWEATHANMTAPAKVLSESVDALVNTGVPTPITYRGWLSHGLVRDIEVDSSSHPDLMKRFDKHLKTNWARSEWYAADKAAQMFAILFKHVLADTGVVPLSVLEAEFSITFAKTHKAEFIVSDSFRIRLGLGYKYAHTGDQAQALVSKTKADACTDVEEWLGGASEWVSRHMLRGDKAKFVSVVTKHESESFTRTYTYKRTA